MQNIRQTLMNINFQTILAFSSNVLAKIDKKPPQSHFYILDFYCRKDLRYSGQNSSFSRILHRP